MNSSKFKKIFTMVILIAIVTFTAYAHLPGPDHVYECPKCANLLKKGSNSSENTLDAILFSDGKMVATMKPVFPNLTKCMKCDTILWLSEMEKLGICDSWNGDCKPEWENTDRAEFLNVADLFRFLDLDIVQSDKMKEKFVRHRIWWAFNDRIREGKEIFVEENDKVLWEQNCLRLIEVLDTSDVDQKITTAELHRNLGKFDACMEIINSLDEDHEWLIEIFKTECDKKNKFLVELM